MIRAPRDTARSARVGQLAFDHHQARDCGSRTKRLTRIAAEAPMPTPRAVIPAGSICALAGRS